MVGLLVALAVGGFAYAATLGDGRGGSESGLFASAATGAMPRAARGEQAPDFTLPDLNGELVSLSGLRGRPVVLFFWTTW